MILILALEVSEVSERTFSRRISSTGGRSRHTPHLRQTFTRVQVSSPDKTVSDGEL